MNIGPGGATTIRIPIVGDTSGLESALNNATGELKGFNGRIKGAMRGVAGSFAAAFAGVQVVGLIGDSLTDASNLEESANRAAHIFGAEFMSSLDAFAATADTTFGLSEQQVLDAASDFGIFGKAAGLADQELVDFGVDFTELAADLASFNNTTPEEAINAIGAAMRGESEPIRRYGVMLDDASLKARALEEGIWDGEGAFSAQTRALAASAEIMAQTTTQQGDFARTSGGLAGQTKILQAQLANVSAEIGAKLLPIAVRLATWFNSEGLPAIQRFGGWLQENIPPILQSIGDWFERHRDTISSVMEAIWTVIQFYWTQVQRQIESGLMIWQGLWNTFSGLFSGDWSQFWEGIRQVFSGLWDKLKQAMELGWAALKFLTALAWEWIKARFNDAMDALAEAVAAGMIRVQQFFSDLPGMIGNALASLPGTLASLGTNAIQSLWDAMKAKGEEALEWVRGFAGRMASAFADALGIGSPSRVFMELGGDVMDGLRIGLDGRPAVRAITGVADSLTTPMTGGRSGATSIAGVGGMTTVIVELDGREIARSVERVSERDGGLRIKTRAGG